MGVAGKLIKGFLVFLLAIIVLIFLAFPLSILLQRGEERPQSPAVATETYTPTPYTTPGPVETTSVERAFTPPSYDKPFFALSLGEDLLALAVPQGGSFTVPISVEAYNGFSSSVKLSAMIGLNYDSEGLVDFIFGEAPDYYNISVAESLAPGEVGYVGVELSDKFPPGNYVLLVSGVSEGLYTSLAVPFTVYTYPGYMIVPRVESPLVEALKEFKVYFDVIPVGGFNETVSLELSSSPYVKVVSFQNNTGIPPFTAVATVMISKTMAQCYMVNDTETQRTYYNCDYYDVDPWANFSLYSYRSNLNVYLLAKGSPGASSAIVLFGVEETPRERGLLDLLFALASIVALPAGVVVGTATGFAMGLATGAMLIPTGFNAVVAGGEVFKATFSMFLPQTVLEDVLTVDGMKGTIINRAGGFDSFVRVGVVSPEKRGSIIIPSASISLGQDALPFVALSREGGGLSVEAQATFVKSRFLFKEEYETRQLEVVVIEEGEGFVSGVVKLGELWKEEGFVKIILKDSEGRVLDVVQAKTPGYWEPQNVVVHVEPGGTALVVIPASILNDSIVSVYDPGYEVYEVQYYDLIPENYYGPGFEIDATRVTFSSYVEANETFASAAYGVLGDSIIVLELKIRGDARPGVYVAYVKVPWTSFVVNVFVVSSEES
ncbi:MAG: hypothetical protein F7C07_05795 [Desulfurococcales archaeon]|nr:hypothetical protein [Desulfurococcales archaeon]